MNNVVENSKASPKKPITAKQLAKYNLTKRKNPDWDNLDRGYRYLTLDMKLPHDQAIAVMGNVVEESLGNYKAKLKNGKGQGLIQWDKAPNSRYGLWRSIWASVAKPANVYDASTDTVKNYWAPWGGLKGDKVRLKFIKAPLKLKTLIYAESYLRPGKPRIADRQLSAMQLDSIYNPRIKNILILKQGGQVRKMQTAAGGPLQLTPEELKYLEWSKMTPELKREYRTNKAKSHLLSGPNITNFWEAFQTYIGNRDPENPHLNTGIVNAPGRATPQLILLSAKLMETINNYWKNLGKLKIRLGGSGKYASGILTKPGTAPTTFNGQNINYITSPKGGNVTHKFYTDLGSEYILTKDGFARRIKSPHSNVEGSDSGLHDWNEGTTIFTRGEDGKLFNTAFYKLSDFGFKPGTYGLVRQNGKAKIMLIDPKTKLWREAMFSDVYPTSVKLGLLLDRVLSVDYSDVPFIGGHILEKTSESWHPGSSVAFIEGLKQGGKMNTLEFLKNGSGIHIKEKNRGSFTRWCGGNVTEECIRRGKNSSNPKIRKKATFADNARHFKHKNGGKAFVNGVSVLDSNPNAYKHVKKKVKMRLYGGPLEYLFKEAQYLKWANDYLNPTVINHNPDIDANRNFKFNNSILQLTDEYNNLKLLEAEKINNEAQRYGSFLSKGLELLFGYLNKPKTISNNSTNFSTDSWSKVKKDLAGTSYIKPDANNKLFTSNVIGSNMNVTYDDMRNLIMQ